MSITTFDQWIAGRALNQAAPDRPSSITRAAAALVERGPTVSVTVSTSNGRSLSGSALIDTGATLSCIDEQAARQLGLRTLGLVEMRFSQTPMKRSIYSGVRVQISQNFAIEIGKVIGVEIASQGWLMLFGRDVLSRCSLIYDGCNGRVNLTLSASP